MASFETTTGIHLMRDCLRKDKPEDREGDHGHVCYDAILESLAKDRELLFKHHAGHAVLLPQHVPPEELNHTITNVLGRARVYVPDVNHALGYDVTCRVYYDGRDHIVICYEPAEPGASIIPPEIIEQMAKIEDWRKSRAEPKNSKSRRAFQSSQTSDLSDDATSNDEDSTDDDSTNEESTDDNSTDEESTDEESTDEESTDEESTDEGSTDEDLDGQDLGTVGHGNDNDRAESVGDEDTDESTDAISETEDEDSDLSSTEQSRSETNDNKPKLFVTEDRIREYVAEDIYFSLEAFTGIHHGLRVRIPVSADEEDDFYNKKKPHYNRKLWDAQRRVWEILLGSKKERYKFYNKSEKKKGNTVDIDIHNWGDALWEKMRSTGATILQHERFLRLDRYTCSDCLNTYKTHIFPYLFNMHSMAPGGKAPALSGIGSWKSDSWKPGIYLGSIKHINAQSMCPMCIFLADMAWKKSETSDYHLHLYWGSELLYRESLSRLKSRFSWSKYRSDYTRAFYDEYFASGNDNHPLYGKFDHATAWKYVQSYGSRPLFKMEAVQETAFFAVVPKACHAFSPADALRQSGTVGFFTITDSNLPFFVGLRTYGTRLQSAALNLSQMRTWIHQCSANGCSKRLKSTKSKRIQEIPIYLISCDTGQVTEQSFSTPYVALSYVWGPSAKLFAKPDVRPPYTIPSQLPQTVRDAITLTRELGFSYIWIDKYCNSSEDDIFPLQMARMDLVYKCAQVTIIDADGVDSGLGLPAMGTRVRQRQATVKIGSSEFVSTKPHLQSILESSPWRKRGWTYQEEFFSTHKLVLTDQQVFYQCPQRLCFESLQQPDPWSHSNREDDETMMSEFLDMHIRNMTTSDETINPRTIDFGSTVAAPKPPLLQIFEYHIDQYSKRHLTYDLDSLNAIRSVLERFKYERSPIYHLWGVPIQTEPKLGWISSTKRRPGQKTQYNILYGLLWTHGPRKRALKRRRPETEEEMQPQKTTTSQEDTPTQDDTPHQKSNTAQDKTLQKKTANTETAPQKVMQLQKKKKLQKKTLSQKRTTPQMDTPAQKGKRQKFPTWTWAGWEGPVTWLPAKTTEGAFSSASDDTQVFYLKGEQIVLAGLWRNDYSNPVPKDLLIRTRTCVVDLVQHADSLSDTSSRRDWFAKSVLPNEADVYISGSGSRAHITLPCRKHLVEINQPRAFPLGMDLAQLNHFVMLVYAKKTQVDGIIRVRRLGVARVPSNWFVAQQLDHVEFYLK